jgi:hypothetical protein
MMLRVLCYIFLLLGVLLGVAEARTEIEMRG